MKTSLLKTKIVPLISAIIIGIIFTVPLGLGNFTNIVATLLLILASFISYGSDGFKSLGISNFKDQKREFFVYAPILAIILFMFYAYALVPGTTKLTGQPIDYSEFSSLIGNLPACAVLLVYIWISAAFGEEIIWRGYFMRHFVRFFGDRIPVLVVNIILFGIVFGYLHSYQGITGQIVTGIIGMILAFIFYKRKYNLWFNIAIHGFFDTIAVIYMYNGWI
ncbi:CPBP family intramembrane glutamic endopeptidase [Dokdonia ponticola]|uniref:CPBP family intramembrane glutamic endopeptidase n=1 Tax=Dokdonia ponticola TaxID=2041041 RepID=A0ABV9HSX1_9FLAO